MKRIILSAVVFILSIFLLAGPAKSADSFIIVSDLDDTVKITDVPHVDNMHCNVVAGKLVFAGMPRLYLSLLGENYTAESLIFLSGTPVIFKSQVQELLNNAQIPRYSLALRGIKEYFTTHTADFKNRKMAEFYGASQGKPFILIGDDTEKDPEVYARFAANRNDVLAVYIHRITGRDLPQGETSFVTAYDLALYEFKAGRLSEGQAAGVGETVLKSDDNVFLPDFQQCPAGFEQIPGLPGNLAMLKKQIEDRIAALCAGRTKKPETGCKQ
jgi:phosphatidate phosphatase APP1